MESLERHPKDSGEVGVDTKLSFFPFSKVLLS